MANIRVDLGHEPIYDGMSLTFKAPCDCTEVSGLDILAWEVTENSSSLRNYTFTFKDAHGNTLTGIGNLFSADSYVKVVLDTVNNFAYLQNADTNAYLEGRFNERVQKIWSGSWSSGSIEVPDWKKYNLFTLTLDGVNCPLLLIRYGSKIRGIGGDITATGLWTASISFTINDDDTWTYNFAGYIRHISGSNHSEATNNCTVTGIWGVV